MTTEFPPYEKIIILGTGAWGTALGALLARHGRDTTLWTRNGEVAAAINASHRNDDYLPSIDLPPSLMATTDASVLSNAEAVISVIPTQFLRATVQSLVEYAPDGIPVALACKGIEKSTASLPHTVLQEAWPSAHPALLSGPSFAHDVAKGLPTAVTLADADKMRRARWLKTLSTKTFRPYGSSDLTGVALGGAIKNVLAIACGIVDGRGLGESARAALISRGFAEASRLATAMGAEPTTLMGLSGLGDMILTGSSTRSRNMSLGRAIGSGETTAEALDGKRTVTEGASTAPVLVKLAEDHGVSMPIADAVTHVLAGKVSVDYTITMLMERPLTAEA